MFKQFNSLTYRPTLHLQIQIFAQVKIESLTQVFAVGLILALFI